MEKNQTGWYLTLEYTDIEYSCPYGHLLLPNLAHSTQHPENVKIQIILLSIVLSMKG